MAWKPKTILGKILKGAVIAGGTVLGLGAGIGAAKGIIGGTGLLSGALTGAKSIVQTGSKLTTAAVNLVTGTTKDERTQVQAVKKDTKAAQDKLDQVQRLINAGATEAEARSMVGLTESELPEVNDNPTTQPMSKTLVYAGLGLLALLLFVKKR